MIGKLVEGIKQANAKRAAELAAYRETLRKPHWCQSYQGKYKVALYFGGFEEPWPVIVTLGDNEIGRRYIMDHNDTAAIKELALEIIRHAEDWADIPEGEEPRIAFAETRVQ
jgi:hypothetical protein